MLELIRFRSEIILWAQAAWITGFCTARSPETFRILKHLPNILAPQMLCCSLPTCGVQHSSTRTCPEVWKSFGHSFCNEQMVGGMVGNDKTHMLQDWVLNIYQQYDTRTLWLDALLLIILTIKFTYFTQRVTIKNKSTVFLFLIDPVVKSRLTRRESEPLHKQQGCICNRQPSTVPMLFTEPASIGILTTSYCFI